MTVVDVNYFLRLECGEETTHFLDIKTYVPPSRYLQILDSSELCERPSTEEVVRKRRCVRAVIAGMAPLLVQKMVIAAFLGPCVFRRWKMCRILPLTPTTLAPGPHLQPNLTPRVGVGGDGWGVVLIVM